MQHQATSECAGASRRSWRVGRCTLVVVAILSFLPVTATSEVNRFVDAQGVLRATTELSDVPEDTQRLDARPWMTTRLTSRELDQLIRWYARRQRLSPALLRAVIKAESDFNPTAVSHTGAVGLMQLMPKTAASLDIQDPFNPVENIRGGARHLRYLLDRFHGNLPLAIAAYNAGESRVKRNRYQIPPIEETQHYVKKVLFYYRTFQEARSPQGQMY